MSADSESVVEKKRAGFVFPHGGNKRSEMIDLEDDINLRRFHNTDFRKDGYDADENPTRERDNKNKPNTNIPF